jgi:hypothetical protein
MKKSLSRETLVFFGIQTKVFHVEHPVKIWKIFVNVSRNKYTDF